jgi:hypothetical protein
MANEAEIIKHLSKEIETQTNCMAQFRSRVNFTIYIGPFLLLGALIIKKDGPLANFSAILDATWALALLAVAFLGQGFFCGLIEHHSWQQCNRWRELIADLRTSPSSEIIPAVKITFKERLKLCYLAVYALLAVEFVAIVAILSSL